jgi:hydrophobic/amphiphilic exporter-1 (mainly G- bacteria), HAE1 family
VRLSEICVQRPVFAFMLIMFMVVMGIFSFAGLGVDLFPKTDPATVFVNYRLPGASPEEVVSQIVMPLEEAVSSVSGIDELRAVVSEGGGFLIVTFTLEKDINEAVEEVREKVSGAVRDMPPTALPPVVRKADPDSDPVVNLALSGRVPLRDLTEVADKIVRRNLETVDGVASATIYGGRARQINLMLDLNKLNGYNITAQEVEQAVRNENVETPGGRIVRGPQELGVRTMGRVSTLDQFNNIIIKNMGSAPVRLKDVGYAEDGMAEKRTFAYYENQPAVLVDVTRQTGTNTVKVVDGVVKKIDLINKLLPPGVKLHLVKETATYIRSSVESLEEHLVLGSLLASIVIWLFIRDFRTVLISSIAIPTSIVTTFSIMKFLDYTLNSMTLLALTLAVGIVIDDAIIVLENIYRYLERDPEIDPKVAAIEATKEISLAVVATTISLVIIFVPIAFVSGYAKRYLNQFGWTMSFSILVSMLVAFTLTPTLSARVLKIKKGGRKRHEEGRDGALARGYVRLLNWSLNHRLVVMALCTLTFASTFVLARHIGRDWMPQEDQSELGVSFEMPEGSSLEATEQMALELGRKVEKIPGVVTVVPASAGFIDRVTMARMTVLLAPPNERGSLNEIAQQIRAITKDYAYLRPAVSFPNALGGRDTFSPIRAILMGPDFQKLAPMARDLMTELLKQPELADMRANLTFNNPELQVKIDRQLASDLGVRVNDVASAVRLLMSGEDEISNYKELGEQYPVTIRLMPEQRDDPQALSRLLVPSGRLGLIRLDSIAKLERGLGPSRIDRVGRQYGIGFYGNPAPGYPLGDAAVAVQRVVDQMDLPTGYSLVFSGQVKILEETTANMILAIGLASVFMYMVLAAQFESLVHPFIILLTLPLSIPFALLSLIVTGRSMNLFSALGILLLLGIVKKNGILQIDCMNRLMGEGMPRREAILEANRIRLRPILMTTFSIVAGLIPTAVAIGTGAATRSAIAVTIIGGQTLCLLLTLVVVPVGYSYVEDARAWWTRRRVAPATSPAVGD